MSTNQQGHTERLLCLPVVRLDVLKDTADTCANQLTNMTQEVGEVDKRLVKLQHTLEAKKARNKSLHAHVKVLREKDQELKTQHKLGLERTDHLNELLKVAEAKLASTRAEGQKICKEMVDAVSTFESNAISIAFKFQSLELNNQQTEEGEWRVEEVADVEAEVTALEAEIESLTSPNIDPLPIQQVMNLLKEFSAAIKTQETIALELGEKQARLEMDIVKFQESETPQLSQN
ncbi:hypothetical protein Pcinc_026050 [Petrolisthes cinctipes]|uniref:Uncharacterized protein n=1 Tax=Petrolisthes cinctipes TaxID=88211 RepID=A0AAE1F7A6_PETCI|nr:hypothetical protein Pcinc_026050 [Petrolisthes cinctipes]